MSKAEHDEILKNQDNERHISYSEFSNWKKCPFYHKLVYIDKNEDFHDSEYTIFGKAIHSVLEEQILNVDEPANVPSFEQKFFEGLKELKEKSSLDKKLVTDMRSAGKRILSDFGASVKEKFPGFEVLGTEELLYEKIPETDFFFKGFIDLVLKVDGKVVLIDWKTCSFWDAQKRSDKITNYQLSLYKTFYCQKHGVEPVDVKTYFGLLKRTAKRDSVEIFESTSGPKRLSNASEEILTMIHAIVAGKAIKNRLSCARCNFQNTELCKR